MSKEDSVRDPLAVDELIRQAWSQKKKWKKPANEPQLSYREWQEILDDRRAPLGM